MGRCWCFVVVVVVIVVVVVVVVIVVVVVAAVVVVVVEIIFDNILSVLGLSTLLSLTRKEESVTSMI